VALTSGSSDFEAAITMMQNMSTWVPMPNLERIQKNVHTADRVFAMLLCARFFVLKKYVDCIPKGTSTLAARRRWVLLQALPPALTLGNDIFVEIVERLRNTDRDHLLAVAKKTFLDTIAERRDLFSNKELFVVLDEAQEAARLLERHFPPTSNSNVLHSVLHDLYRFLHHSKFFVGIIVSGTGLSSETVKASLGSMAGKQMTSRTGTTIFTGSAVFSDESEQEKYIRGYLTISEDNLSDRYLLERMKRWCMGRCVFLEFFDLSLTSRIVIDLQPVSSNSFCTHQTLHVIKSSLNSLRK
jgi:hypothetical protein